jgi:beta-galactosidase
MVVLDTLRASGLASSDPQLPPTVRLKQGINSKGKRIHYYLNYSSAPASFKYGYAAATNLLTGNQLSKGAMVKVGSWDLVIAEESAPSE